MTAQVVGRIGAYHKVPMREPAVINEEVNQDLLSVSAPLCVGAQSADGGLKQGQLIAGSPASVQTGLPRLTNCSGDGRIEVW